MTPRARILLIDDDEVDFVITKKLLDQVPEGGYELEWVDSFEEGARALKSGRYAAGLIDYRLGARSGLDLLRSAGQAGWNVPMILLTAHGNRAVDAEALALGAVGYLEKSRLGAGELDRALRYALAREGLISGLVEQNAELLCMHHMTSMMLGAGSSNERLARACEELANHMAFPVALLERALASDCASLETLVARGLQRADQPEREHALAHSPARAALGVGRAQLLVDAATPPDAARPWPWAQAAVALPIRCEGTTWGALTLADHRSRTIDSDQLQRAAILADHLARLLAFLAAPTVRA